MAIYFDNLRIKQAALQRGYTLSDVARAIGTSPERVRQWSRGHSSPNAHELARIASFCDCEVQYFFQPVRSE